ncbi:MULTISPECIES: hypothetical protein [Pseudomonas]|uniref:hypothetical protein n=1 Tax=Pseudomonas TaxID=286 RepID=UPI000CD08DBF|nr:MULTISPECIES: hypothetical protein [unclassified Pseudomonas]POA34985.1 hypothetical protein C1887_02565 [Pseudomonas sp. GW456-R21]POA70944.1 hypothetical protein C1884_02115 [Pseudomonas sp. GW460-R15]
MPNFSPLQSNLSLDPTLFINLDADACDLFETAIHRLKIGRNLLNSVSCLSVKDAEGYDLEHFANAAHLLIQDGCDALDALGWKLSRNCGPTESAPGEPAKG